MELISREQAIETFKDCAVNGVGIDGIVDALEQLPPIQPEPSEECERCMMEHMDEMERLETELAFAKIKREVNHESN